MTLAERWRCFWTCRALRRAGGAEHLTECPRRELRPWSIAGFATETTRATRPTIATRIRALSQLEEVSHASHELNAADDPASAAVRAVQSASPNTEGQGPTRRDLFSNGNRSAADASDDIEHDLYGSVDDEAETAGPRCVWCGGEFLTWEALRGLPFSSSEAACQNCGRVARVWRE